MKRLETTPKFKSVPMPDDVIQVVNDMEKQVGMPNGIQFHNIHHESTLVDLFTDNDLRNEDSCVSDTDWDLNKKPEEDLKKKLFNDHVNNDEVEDLNINNKTYSTLMVVAILVATLEFNTNRKTNIIILVALS